MSFVGAGYFFFRVAAAFFAAALLLRVAAAFLPAARRFLVAAPFLAAALRLAALKAIWSSLVWIGPA